MINIYHLEGNDPIPIRKGYFSNNVLYINDKEIKMTEKEVLDHFNRGYWRCGSV